MIFESEAELEENVISMLKQHGWANEVLHYPTEADLLKNWAEILFHNNSGSDRLNGHPLTEGEMAQILEQIERLKTPLALNSFINGKTVAITRDNPDDELHLGKEISLKIYDREEIAAGSSIYQIAQQPIYPAKNKMLNDRRGDLCLLINGMPLIHIELKRSGVPISQATEQIKKYAHEGVFTGIFRLVQIFVAMNPNDAVYFANPGEGAFNPSYYFHWADFYNEPICAGNNDKQDSWKYFTSDVLSIPTAHRLIGFYTIADSDDGCLKVMRSYQCYAAQKISDTVQKCDWDEEPPTPGRPGGYVWHTTGSGKTMTSFKSAQLVAESKDADKVIFLMDRIELGTQSLKEYQSFADDKGDVQETKNTAMLKAKLASTNPSDVLIVTSIQKMSNIRAGEGGITQAELEKLADQRIVFIVDECHRTTFGDMLQTIRQSFPGALFFGFTGTPILDENQKKGSTTAMVFGDQLHRYSIADGIRDGNVLGFDPYMVMTYRDRDVRQQVALDKAKAETQEEAYKDPKKAEVYEHYMDKTKVPMASRISEAGEPIYGIEHYLTPDQYGIGSEHVQKVVEDIKEQFPVLSHSGKFHAILATSSIPEAINYYHLFKQQAPQMQVTALFDPNIDNTEGAIVKEDALAEIISDYNALYGKDFTIPTWSAMKKDISSRLSHKMPYGMVDRKREERIDLLIVVSQMLTGFDSKWVNTLYLDKIIRYQDIIQAFSRTNRLFGPDKPFGTIRYYRKPHTMKANIAAAVELYSGDRPPDLFVQKLPDNISSMNSRFEEINSVFSAAGVDGFTRLPEAVEACQKFAKEFIELNGFLEAAKVQGFTWEQGEYTLENEQGKTVTVSPKLDEQQYLALVQRYKELFAKGNNTGGEGPEPEAPYELDGYITEIDTGLIDADYMNSNFQKWRKALHDDSPVLEAVSTELHRSFATLSQNDQRLAELILHDIQSGDVDLEENDSRTLRDFITEYASREEKQQIDKVVDFFGLDRSLLTEMMKRHLTKANLNEYGHFTELEDSMNIVHTCESFERILHEPVSPSYASVKGSSLLETFLCKRIFDVENSLGVSKTQQPPSVDKPSSSATK